MRFLNAGIAAGLVAAALLLAGGSSAGAATDPGLGASESPTGNAPASIGAAAVNPTATATTLSSGLRGFDNIGADSSATLRCLSDAGYSFDVIDALGAGWDSEYRSAAALGLSAVLFQGYYQPLWSDPQQGTARGQLMVSNAQSVGYPQGAQVFLNLENNLTDGTNPVARPAMIQWVQNWAAAVTAAGYTAGVYVGVPQLLTGTDLDSALLAVSVLWRSASGSAPPSGKGYVLRQPAISQSQCGVSIDTDTASADNLGMALVGAGFPRGATTPAVAGALGPLSPTRIVDSRYNGGPLQAGAARTVQIRGAGGIPSTGVSAVLLNLTVTDTTAAGYLSAYPDPTNRPLASNLNFTAGQTVANLVVVPVANDGTIQVYNGAPGTVDIVADVAGYYRSGTPTAAGTFGALTPHRITDTRVPGNSAGGALNGLSGMALQVTGQGGVPSSGVAGVVINLTATNAGAGGYLTAWPSGSNRPLASNLNFTAGQNVPNLVVVPVGRDGKVMLFNGAPAAVDLIADVVGYIVG